jgi:hypothetical protein
LKPLKAIRLLTAMLGFINAGLLASLPVIWHTGQARIRHSDHIAAHPLSLPDLSVLTAASAPKADVTAIRDNALFYSRRSFYEPPPPSQLIAPPEYELAGTMRLPDNKRLAFVKRKSDHASRSLHVGEDLEGWRVESIEASRIVLARNEQRTEVTSNVVVPATGLIHGDADPHVTQSATGVLRSRATLAPARRDMRADVRTYRPPPP